MLIDLIAGARPNFMKIAPITHAMDQARMNGQNIRYRLVHTGQHYDRNMSENFFRQLNIPAPDINLGAGGGSQASQAAAIITGYEKVLDEQGPVDLCMVVGDVTSTMACSIVARLKGIKVAHVEGGLRSRDFTMPEEINRVVTDRITDFYFTTSEQAGENLYAEGVNRDQVFFVGNTMIDTLYAHLSRLRRPELPGISSLKPKEFFVLTLHRPANVDRPGVLSRLLGEIAEQARNYPLLFPAHPRTRKQLDALDLPFENLHALDPMGYLEFIWLVQHARAVITDSGGVTEESTVLGVPCLTLRDNTERPETVTTGTNELIGTDPAAIAPAMQKLMNGKWKSGSIPDKWDGKTSTRIVQVLLQLQKQGRLAPDAPYLNSELLFKG